VIREQPILGCHISFFQFISVSDIIMTLIAKGKALLKWFDSEKPLRTHSLKGIYEEETT
jgi:hypothetical protein